MKQAMQRVLAAVACGGAVFAQEQVWGTWGNPNLQIDGNNAVVGDVNQDGHEDIAIISNGRCNAVLPSYVRMLSGRDGAVLYDVPALFVANGPTIRDIAAAGDWNHDGVPDFATMQYAAPFANFVVHDGATGATLFVQPQVADEICADVDVDGDGWNDMIAANRVGPSGLGLVTVRSHNGTLLYQFAGTPALQLGNYVTKIGDIDDDGCGDFVVTGLDSALRGASIVVSGSAGTFLRICYGQPGDFMSSCVDAAGDWDGDGYQEFVVASIAGSCAVFSARTGQMIRSWYSTTSGSFAGFVAGRGIDYDGDNFPDIVAGDLLAISPTGTAGMVYVLSGRDGTTIHRLVSTMEPAGMGKIGAWVNGLRPGPGSHVGTVIAPDKQATLAGGVCPVGPIESIVRAYRGLPRTSQVLSPPCAGNLAQAPDIGLQSLGVYPTSIVRVHLSDAPPNVPALLLLGAVGQATWVPTPLALDGIGLPGCSLWGPVEVMTLMTTGTGTNAGYCRVDLPLPVPPGMGVGTWWVSAQWLVLGTTATFPGGMTQAVRWRR